MRMVKVKKKKKKKKKTTRKKMMITMMMRTDNSRNLSNLFDATRGIAKEKRKKDHEIHIITSNVVSLHPEIVPVRHFKSVPHK
jgi:hypothetical protein